MALPRSALLAAWTAAVVAGRAAVQDAVAAVTADEEHDVSWRSGATGGPADLDAPAVFGHDLPDPAFLSDLLVVLADAGPATTVRMAMPVPGDAVGLPRARGLLGHAVDIGECVVVDRVAADGAGADLALVPEAEMFGTEHEYGHRVSWLVWACRSEAPPGTGGPGSVAEADLELRTGLRDAVRELERLDAPSWSRGEGLALPVEADLPPLPDTFSPRSRAVIASAVRVLDIVEAAARDHGGAVSGHDVSLRSAALDRARRAARRALVAAVNLPG